MGGIDWIVEAALVCLLCVTLLYAIRLQRAISSLRHDRSALQDAVEGFDAGTRAAEAAMARLREAAEQLGGQLSQATALRDDLMFLSERGEALADRLDALVRAARAVEPALAPPPPAFEPELPPAPEFKPPLTKTPPPRSQAERSLLAALQARR